MAINKIKGKWHADISLVGSPRVRKVFPKGTLKKEALAFISESKQLDLANNNANMKKNFSSLRFYAIAELYISHLSKTKAIDNKSYIKKAVSYWGEKKVSSITPKLTRQWIESLFKEKNEDGASKYAVSTVQKFLTYFKAVFNHAVKEEVISHNPISKVEFTKAFKKKNKRETVISREAFERLYALFSDAEDHIKYVLIALWYSGMRINEVLNLKWSSVNFDMGVIILSGDEVKEGKSRFVSLEKEFLDVLKTLDKLRPYGSYVFSLDVPNKISYSVWRYRWKKAIKGTEFEMMKTHDLRHCYATIRYQEGHSKETIKFQLGHTSDSMFTHYNTVGIEDVVKMAGFHSEKRELIEDDVRLLMQKVRDNNIPMGTLQASIRDLK